MENKDSKNIYNTTRAIYKTKAQIDTLNHIDRMLSMEIFKDEENQEWLKKVKKMI